jgi:5'-3' exonuclease
VQVHLVDGTYELFRYFFALPSHVTGEGQEVGAVRGVVGTVMQLIEGGATHVGVATDHIIESFRNDLWPGYKTGAGIDPDLRSQFGLLEDALAEAGFCVWPMVEYEADDALASAATIAAADPAVEQVLICTPDKDLAQCVDDDGRIVLLDRRREVVYDRAGVVEKFGVPPASIPDYLALVGDSADGFPGIKGWGAKSAGAVLARWGHLDALPADPAEWDVPVRGPAKLAASLADGYEHALLFRRLATLEREAPTISSVEELEWRGPRAGFLALCERLDATGLADRARKAALARGFDVPS